MSQLFKLIVIIYNPNSTGDGQKNAEQLRDDLVAAKCTAAIKLKETTHAGHAEEIAGQYAHTTERTLLVSSSGDGGYHELINGVINTGNDNILTAVLPSGNANDHHRAIGSEDITSSITTGATHSIDAIKITSIVDGKPWTRYAHSYAGIGLTPTIGRKLTQADLNFVNEKLLLIKYLFKYTHATVRINGIKKRFSSLVFSNVNQMSKVVKLAKLGTVDDGKFEISSIKYRSKLVVVLLLIKSATFGLDEVGSRSEYSFKTTKRLMMQLDGEIYTLDADSDVTVQSAAGAIQTIQ